MVRNCFKYGLRLLGIVFVLMVINANNSWAQTSGLIYKPATGEGVSILDPNRDGYVSGTTSGFSFNDTDESEIRYIPLYQTGAEATRDVRTGPPGGHTDLVGQYGDGKKTAFMNYDAANNALLFRVRIAKQSKASKGYSFLFNTDFEQFGPKATNFSRTNPGFQYEVVLETNFGISIYDWSGGNATEVWSSSNFDDYFQKAISYKHYGQSGDSGENGYFYDFYIPLDEVPADFRNELLEDFRVTVSTITNAQRGIEGVISDILGSGSLTLQSECLGGIGSLNCVEVDPTTITPDINIPLYDGDTAISGRLAEEDGSTVYIYKNGIQIGTETVTDFEWEFTGISALAEGDVITARASTSGKNISDYTAGVTVLATGSFVPCQDGTTPVPTNVSADVPNVNNGHVEGISGNSESGATIFIYDESFNLIAEVVDNGSNDDDAADGSWYYTAKNPGFVYINSQSSNPQLCQSEYVTVNAERSVGTTITSKTAAPSITSDPDVGGTSVEVQNLDAASATIYLYINENYVDQVSGVGANATTTFSGLAAFSEEDVIAARAKNDTDALSDRVYKVISTAPEPPEPDQSEAPEIVGDYVAGANITVEGFSTEEAGTKIKLYVNGGEPVDSTEVLIDNTWELEVASLSGGDVLTATATAPQETESEPSAGVTVLSGISAVPAITSDLTIYSTEISGTSSASGTLTIYVDDGAIGTKEITGNWTFTDSDAGQGSGYIQNELYQGATVTATLTEDGKPESDQSGGVTVTGITSFSLEANGGGDIGTQVAGTTFDVDIAAKEGPDGTGNTFAPFVDNVLIYSVEAPITNGFRVTNNFTSGTITHSTQFDDGAEDVVLRALYTDNPEITGASNAFLVNNPEDVTLTSITPQTKYAGEAEFELTLRGTNFVSSSTVRVNGSDRTTNFVSSTELKATILESDISSSGTLDITVISPPPQGTGGETDPITLTVEDPPAPMLTNVNPDNGDQFSTFDVVLTGTNLIENGVTTVDFGPDITINSTSSNEDYTELTANITINGADTGLRDVSVTNPAPLGGTATLTDAFTVNTSSYTQFIINTIASPQTAGEAFEITISAADGSGTTFEGFTGQADLEFPDGNIDPVSTGNFVDGVWTGNVTVTKVGTDLNITATNADGTGNQTGTSNPFDVNAASASQYLVTVSNETPQAGTDITVTAQLADQYGNAVSTSGKAVTWSSTNIGDGFFGSATSTTNGDGIATVTFTPSSTEGVDHKISATDGDGNTGQSPTITTTSAPPTKIVFTSAEKTTSAGISTSLIVIELQDESDNTRSATSNTTISLTSGSGTGVFRNQNNSGNLTNSEITIPAGVSSVSFRYRDNTAGDYTITAVNGNLSNDSQSITINPGALDGFTWNLNSPQTNGTVFNGTNTLSVVDQYDNVIENFDASADNVTVTTDLSGTVSGLGSEGNNVLNRTEDFTNGVANLENLIIYTGDTGTGTFTATSANDSKIGESESVTIQAGDATQIVVETAADGSGEALSDSTVSSGDSITAYAISRDQSDNFVELITDATWSLMNKSDGVVDGDLADNEDGSATFTGTLVGSAVINAASGSLTETPSGTITVEPGDATKLAITTQPAGGSTGDALATQPVVEVQDAAGNVVTDDNSTEVTVAILSGADGTLSGTTSVTAENGIAEFTDLTLAGTVGEDYVLRFTATDVAETDSNPVNISAGAASSMIVSTQPANTTAGETIGGAPAVTITDSEGNPISGINVTVSINKTDFASGAETQTTDASGIAEFDDLVLETADTGYELTFNAGAAGVDAANSDLFEITPAAASQLVITQQPNPAEGSNDGTPASTGNVVVETRDQFGNTSTEGLDVEQNVTVALGTDPTSGEASLVGTTTKDIQSGTATFDDLTLDRDGTGFTLTFASDSPVDLGEVTSNPFDMIGVEDDSGFDVALAEGGNKTAGKEFDLEITSATGTDGNNLDGEINITVTSNIDNEVHNAVVTFTSGSASVPVTLTTADDHILTVSVTGISSDENLPVTVEAAAANYFTLTSAESEWTAGTPETITINAFDEFDNGATGYTGDREITFGGANAAPNGTAPAVTDKDDSSVNFGDQTTIVFTDGEATDIDVRLYAVEIAQLTATDGAVSENATLDITVGNAGLASFLVQEDGGQAISTQTAGEAFNLELTALDAYENTAESYSGTVDLSVNGSAFAGDQNQTTGNFTAGELTGFGVTVTQAAETVAISVEDSGDDSKSGSSNDFEVVANVPAALAFGQQPTNAASGAEINPAVTVRVEDEFGNLTNSSSTIYLSIGNDPSSDATLSGDRDIDAIEGMATFSDVSIDNSGEGYTLVASDASAPDGATGLADVTSDAFDIGASTLDNFLVEASGGDITEQTAGEYFDIQITARDANNNTITDFTGTVNLALNKGSFASGGDETTSFTNGILDNHAVQINTADTGYEITATNSDGSETGSSNDFEVIAGPIAALQFSQQPTDTQAGATISPVTVQLLDNFENEVAQENENISLSISDGATLNNGSATTGANGLATFDNLSVAETGEDYILNAELDSDTDVTTTSDTFDITVGAGVASNSLASVPDGTAGETTDITITVLDSENNPVTGAASDLGISVSDGPNSDAAFTAINDEGYGTYTVSYTPITAGDDEITITLNATGISGSPYTSTVTAGPPADVVFTSSEQTITAGENSSDITIELQDANGNIATAGSGGIDFDLSTDGDGEFRNTGNENAITSIAIAEGSSDNSFRYYSETAFVDQLSVTDQNGSGVGTADQNITIEAGPISVAETGSELSGTDLTRISDGNEAATVTLQLKDEFGNDISEENVAVEFATTDGDLSATSTTTNADGQASVTLTSTTTGDFDVTARVDDNDNGTADADVTSGSPVEVIFSAGDLSQLTFISHPQAVTQAGATIGTVTVRLEDNTGNLVEQDGTSIMLAISEGATLVGATTQTTTDGIATFDDLYTIESGTGYTLTATSDGLNSDQSNSFDITRRPITVTADTQSKTYGDADPDFTYQITEGSLIPDVNLNGSLSRTAGEDVATFAMGTYVITQNDLTNANNPSYAITFESDDLTIEPRDLTLSNFATSDKEYDGTINASGIMFDDDRINDDELTFDFDASFTDKLVGDGKTVSIENISIDGGADAGNYDLQTTSGSATADITAKELTVTGAAADEKVYDGNSDAIISGATLQGAVSGDDVSLDELVGTFTSTDVAADVEVTVALTMTGTDAGNYTLTQPTGLSADITPLELTIGGSFTAEDKVYDSDVSATIDENNLTLETPVGGDNVTLDAVAEFEDESVETGKNVSLTASTALTGNDSGNYTLSLTGAPTTTADITSAAVTVTQWPEASDITYGEPLSSATLSNGSANQPGSFAFTDDTVVPTSAGTYSAEVTFTPDNESYATLTENIDVEVLPKELTISGAEAEDKTYDGTDAAAITGATLEGVINDNNVNLTNATSGTFAQVEVGMNIEVSTSFGLAGDDAGNYTLTQPTGLTADIIPLELTIAGSFTAEDKVYDGDVSATIDENNLTLETPVVGDDVSLVPVAEFEDETVETGKNVSLTASTALTGDDSDNYVLSLDGAPTTTADIINNGVTVSEWPEASDITYGEDVSRSTLSGGAADQPGSFAFTDETVVPTSAGTFSTEVTFTPDNDNYTTTIEDVDVEVLPKELTVSGAEVEDKTYDETNTATIIGATLEGVINDDDVSLTNAASGTFAQAEVGINIEVSTNFGLAGDDAGNYTLTQSAGLTADITAGGITVTQWPTASDITYGEALGNATLSNGSANQSGSFAFTDPSVEPTAAGTYSAEVTFTPDDNNFIAVTDEVDVEVLPKNLMVTDASASDKIYDANTNATISGATLQGAIAGDDVSLDATVGTFDDGNVGAGIEVIAAITLTGADAGNYTLTQPTGLTADITPLELTVGGSFTAEDKVYDGDVSVTIDENNLTLETPVGGDDVTLDAVAEFEDETVGTDKPVNLTEATSLDGADANNYTLSMDGAPGTQADITPDVISASNSEVTTTSPHTADGTDASTITITLQDSDNNRITGLQESDFNLSYGDNASLATFTEVGNGEYSYELTNSTAEEITITVTADGTELDDKPTVTFEPGPISASNSEVTATSPHTADGTDASTVTIELKDANGNAIGGLGDSDFSIDLTGNASAGSVSETETSGTYEVAVTNSSVESSVVTVTANDTELDDKPAIIFQAGAPDNLTINSGDGQTKTVTGTLDDALEVKIIDANGHPVNNETVNFSITGIPTGSNGESLSTASATTDTDGLASTGLTLGDLMGTYEVTAASGDLSDVTFTATAVADAPDQIVKVSGDGQTDIEGATLDNSFVIRIEDQYGNPIENQALTFSISNEPDGTSGSSLSTESTTTDGNGEVSSTLTFGDQEGSYEVTVSSGSLSDVVFTATATSSNTDPVLATNEGITVDEGDEAGITSTELQVNDAEQAAGNIIYTINSDPENGDLKLNGTPLSDSDTFTQQDIDDGNISYQHDGTETNSDSFDFTVSDGDGGSIGTQTFSIAVNNTSIADQLLIVSGNNQSQTVNQALDDPLVVEVLDAQGNPEEDITVNFSIAQQPDGANAELSTESATTDADGRASTSLTLDTIAGSYEVDASVTDLTDVTFTAEATPAAADAGTSLIIADDESITADGSSSTTITVQLKDQYGNDLTTGGDDVTLDTDAGTMDAVTDQNDGTYTATLTSSTTAETAIITGSVNDSAIDNDETVDFTVGDYDLTQSTISVDKNTITADGTDESTVTVQLKDANGNDIASGGETVVISTDLGNVSAISDQNDGTYTAALTSTTTGTATVSATVDGSAVTSGNPEVTIIPGAAASIVLTGPTENLSSGDDRTLTATIYDSEDNIVTSGDGSDLNVEFTKSSGTGTVNGLQTVAATNGIAAVDVIGQLSGAVTIQAEIITTASVTLNDDLSFTVTSGLSTPTITAPGNDSFINADDASSVTISGTASGAGQARITITDSETGEIEETVVVNSGDYSDAFDVSGLDDGELTITVVGIDEADNESDAASITVMLDQTPPELSVNDQLINDDTPAITGTSDQPKGSEITVTINGETYTGTTNTNGDWSIDVTDALPDNEYTVNVMTSDEAGNEATDTGTITIDTQAPAGSVSWNTDPVNSTNKNAAEFDISDGEDGAGFDWTITDGTDQISGSGTFDGTSALITNQDVSGLADGTLTVSVTLTDPAGNEGSAATDDVTKNTTAPSITFSGGSAGDATSSANIAENTMAVRTFSANETVTWSLSGGADQSILSIDSSSGVLSFNAAPDFESPADDDTNNDYVVEITATDEQGNASTQTVTVTVTDVDEAAPANVFLDSPSEVKVRASVGSDNVQSLDVSYSYSDADPDEVTLTFDDGSGNTATYTIDDSGYAGDGSTKGETLDLSSADATGGNGFMDGSTYDITIEATDASDNSGSDTGEDLLTVDNTAPSLTSASVNGSTLTLTYDETLDGASDPAVGQYRVEGTSTGAQQPTAVDVEGTTVTLTLGTPIEFGETVSLDYTVPGADLVQDEDSENDAAALNDQAVTNNTTTALIASTDPSSLMETNLNTAAVTVDITNGTYVASDNLEGSDFSLASAPSGTSITSSVTRNSDTSVTLTMAFDGTDYDTDTTISVNVLVGALASGTPATTPENAVTPAAANAVTLSAPDSVTAGAVSGPFTLTATEPNGSPMVVEVNEVLALSTTSETGQFFADAQGDNAITSLTIAAGQSSISFYYRDNTSGTSTLTATDGTDEGADLGSDTQQLTVIPGGASTATSTVTASPDTVGTDENSVSIITVQLKDDNGNNLTSGGENITLNTDIGTLSEVTDNGDGTYSDTLRSTVVGQASISASLNGDAIDDKAEVTILAGKPANLVKISGDSQTGPAGDPLEEVLMVKVTDEHDNPVQNTNVNFAVIGVPEDAEGASLNNNTVQTDSAGTAAVTFTLGNTPGAYTIEVGSESLERIQFTAEATAAAVANIIKIHGDNQAQPTLSVLNDSLVIKLTDRFENPIQQHKVVYSLSQKPQDAAGLEFTPKEAQTDSNGLASSKFKLGDMGGEYQIVVRAENFADSVQFTATGIESRPNPTLIDTVNTVVFNGMENTFIFAEPNASLNNLEEVTAEIWILPDSLTSSYTIMEKGDRDDPSSSQFRIRGEDNTVHVELSNASSENFEMEADNFFVEQEEEVGSIVSSQANQTVQQTDKAKFKWTHIAVAVDVENQQASLYRNGFKVDEVEFTGELNSGNRPLRFGSGFKGEIHEIRIWNKHITQPMIQSRLTEILEGTEENLVLYNTFDDKGGNGNEAEDMTSNGNDLFLTQEVVRTFSIRGVPDIETNEDEDYIMTFKGLDEDEGRLDAVINELPKHGTLYQVENGGQERGSKIITTPTTLTDPENRALYEPDPYFFGQDSLGYELVDSFSNSADAVRLITINPINNAPVVEFGSETKVSFDQRATLRIDLTKFVEDVDNMTPELTWEAEVIVDGMSDDQQPAVANEKPAADSSLYGDMLSWQTNRHQDAQDLYAPNSNDIRVSKYRQISNNADSERFNKAGREHLVTLVQNNFNNTEEDSLVIEIDQQNDDLIFTTTPMFTASDIPVIVKALDPNGAVGEDTLSVTVNFVNDPPSVFEQLMPAPSDTVKISDVNSAINFSWQQTSDLEQDSLSYILHLTRSDGEERTFSSIPDTTFTLSRDDTFVEFDTNYSWRVRATDGVDTTASAKEHSFLLVEDVPLIYSLPQNYPNPFTTSTVIEYGIPIDSKVKIILYNVLGQRIDILVDKEVKAGLYTLNLDAQNLNLASGIYIYRMVAEGIPRKLRFVKTQKMTFIK